MIIHESIKGQSLLTTFNFALIPTVAVGLIFFKNRIGYDKLQLITLLSAFIVGCFYGWVISKEWTLKQKSRHIWSLFFIVSAIGIISLISFVIYMALMKAGSSALAIFPIGIGLVVFLGVVALFNIVEIGLLKKPKFHRVFSSLLFLILISFFTAQGLGFLRLRLIH